MTQAADPIPLPATADPYVGSTPRYASDNARTIDRDGPPPEVNVGSNERTLSLAGGALLAIVGLRARNVPGLLAFGAGAALIHRGYSGHCNLYAMLGKSTADDAPAAAKYFHDGIHLEVAYTIEKPRAELYAFWRDFANLPRFMKHLESVEVLDEKRSRWTANAPAGRTVSWEAEIINEKMDELIAWRSLGGADVDNAGSVRFVNAPGDRGTEVRVVLDYIPPAGRLGKYIAMLFGEAPEIQIKEDLRRFKRLMETGHPPTIDGQSMGNCRSSR